MTWLRGGYENAVSVIDTLKEQSRHLEDNLAGLEKQKSDLKESYDVAIEQVNYCLFNLDVFIVFKHDTNFQIKC